MDKLPKLKKSAAAQLYEALDSEYGKVKNPAMEPSLLNSMLRYTVLPKVGDTGAIQPKYCGNQKHFGWHQGKLGRLPCQGDDGVLAHGEGFIGPLALHHGNG